MPMKTRVSILFNHTDCISYSATGHYLIYVGELFLLIGMMVMDTPFGYCHLT